MFLSALYRSILCKISACQMTQCSNNDSKGQNNRQFEDMSACALNIPPQIVYIKALVIATFVVCFFRPLSYLQATENRFHAKPFFDSGCKNY